MHRWASTQMFLFFFTWTTFLSYWSLIFNERGFGTVHIGTSITVSLITRAIAIALLLPLANQRWPLGVLVRALPWLSFLVGLTLLTPLSVSGLIVVSAAFGLLYPTMMPMAESLATIGAARGAVEYGTVRTWGSIGFIVGTAVNGVLASFVGNAPLLWLFLGAIAVMAVLSLLPIGDDGVAAQRSGSIGSWGPLLRHPVVAAVLGISILIQASHGAYYAFGALQLQRMGAAAWVISLFIMLAPLSEMVAFRCAHAIMRSVALWHLLVVVVTVSALRWIVWAMLLPVPLLIASQTLHGITFGLMQVALVAALRRHVGHELIIPAQSMNAAIGGGVATAVLTWVAGALLDVSVLWAFAPMVATALIAGALIPLTVADRRTAAEEHLGSAPGSAQEPGLR